MAITSIATLAEVKNYLRMPNPQAPSQDDVVIQSFMDAAQAVIEAEVGHIVKKKIRLERHNGGVHQLWLRELPILYVENVQEGWGYYDWDLDDQQVNSLPALSIWAYSLDMPTEGLLTRRSAGSVNIPFVGGVNNIVVSYVVGATEMPANAVLAFMELVAHWYRVSQQRTANQASAAFSPNQVINQDFTRSTGITSINMGIPIEIMALLSKRRKRPIIG